MRRYAVIGSQNVGTISSGPPGDGSEADASICGLVAATTVRGHLYYISLGAQATPAAQQIAVGLKRFTAVGTWTSVTPAPLDGAEPVAALSGRSNSTAAPTYTAATDLLARSCYQTGGGFEWFEDASMGFIIPATASNGLGLYYRYASNSGALYEATFHHAEI